MKQKIRLFLSISLAILGVFAILLVVSAQSPVQEPQIQEAEPVSEWPQQGYDPQRTSFNPHEWKLGRFNVGDLDVLWSSGTPCTINTGPSVVDGIVYYGHYCGEFKAVNADTGATIWSREINKTETSHTVVEGIAFVTARCTYTTCGMVYAFDAYSGDVKWTWDSGTYRPQDLVFVDSVLYVTLETPINTNELIALDASTGSEIWHSSQGGVLAVDNGKLYVTQLRNPTNMVVLDAANGSYLWSGKVEGDFFSRPAVSGPFVYVSSDNGKLYVFDSSGCGEDICLPLWTGLTPGLIKNGPQAPALAYGKVFLGADDTFYAFDAGGCGAPECEALWQTETACTYFSNRRTPPSVGNGVVYSACGANYIYAFNATSGEILWQYYTSGGYPMRASPAIADGRLYHAATFNFRIYAFEAPYHGIYLHPDYQTGDAIPGDSLSYELSLQNNSWDSDSFRLDYGGNEWPTMLSITETPTISSGNFITFNITIDIPDDLPWYLTDTVVVTATSLTNATQDPLTAQVSTRLYAPPQIRISPVFITSTQDINQTNTQILTIQNGNGVPLTYNLDTRGLEELNWLTAEPISGTVPTESSQIVLLTLDSVDLQPDIYTTNLIIQNNDPLRPMVQIPVTMTVEPTHNMGWVEGTITDLRNGEPLAASITVDGQPYLVNSNPETGYYKLWLTPDCYEMHIESSGYVSQTVPVKITSKNGTTHDAALLLDAPWIQVTPDSISTTQAMGALSNHSLNIRNTGATTLTFNIDTSASASKTTLLFHMDEMADSTTFMDSSGLTNHGSCSEPHCPISGIPGKYENAVQFDGLDDYIVVPDSPSLNPQDAMAISAWIYPEDWGTYNRRIVQKGYSDNQYLFSSQGLFRFRLEDVGIADAELPSTGAWHHVVGLYNGSVIQIWIDGQLKAETAASGKIATTSNPLYIGTKHSSAPISDHFHGLIDELIIFDRGLSPAEILALYTRGLEELNWLIAEPISGTVPTESSQIVLLTLDSVGLQPDIYTTNLIIQNNDPLRPLVQIPVTMTVEPTHNMGWVEGTVTDLRTGEPLEAVITAADQPYLLTSNPETGYYKLWLTPGLYELKVDAPGYVSQTVPVKVTSKHGTIQDIPLLLDAPWMSVSPETISTTLQLGTQTHHLLNISNTGATTLTFNILTPRLGLEGVKVWLTFDDLEDSTFFQDSSGNNYHATCEEPTCPTNGGEGVFGQGIDFDGVDDYLEVTPFPFGGPFSVSVWVKSHNVSAHFARIIDFHNGAEDDNIVLCWFKSIGQMDLEIWNVNSRTHMETSEVFPENEWVHVAAVIDEGGTGYLYWNGKLIKTGPMEMPWYTQRAKHWLGKSAWWWVDDWYDGQMDDFILFDRALTENEVQMLYQGIGGSVNWLSSDPISGTIAANSDLQITLTLDASDLSPGTFTANLYITSDDPLNPLATIPITLTVPPLGNTTYFPLIMNETEPE